MNRLEKSTPPRTSPMIGMKMSSTSEETMVPNAPPMMMPTAMSIMLPLTANSLNSLRMDMFCLPVPAALANIASLDLRRLSIGIT